MNKLQLLNDLQPFLRGDRYVIPVKSLFDLLDTPTTSDTIQLNGYMLYRRSRTVERYGVPIALTPREFNLTWLLFTHVDSILPRDTIARKVWPERWNEGMAEEKYKITDRTIEQHIYMLRKKLKFEMSGMRLKTLYLKGYLLTTASTGEFAQLQNAA